MFLASLLILPRFLLLSLSLVLAPPLFKFPSFSHSLFLSICVLYVYIYMYIETKNSVGTSCSIWSFIESKCTQTACSHAIQLLLLQTQSQGKHREMLSSHLFYGLFLLSSQEIYVPNFWFLRSSWVDMKTNYKQTENKLKTKYVYDYTNWLGLCCGFIWAHIRHFQYVHIFVCVSF